MDLTTPIDLNPWTLAAAFVFGVAGLYLLRQGRKNTNLHWVAIGVVLMIYPYLISGAAMTWLTGFALCGLAYYFQDRF